MATRQIEIGTTVTHANPIGLPVTDASLSMTREPVMEQSMSGKGGEILYGGLYSAAQGAFGGAYRPDTFNTYIADMFEVPQTAYSFKVFDDQLHGVWAPTSYITSCEISMKVGELEKCAFNFVGQGLSFLSAGPSVSASFDNGIPVFYPSSGDWGTCSEFTSKIERPSSADA